MNAERLMHFRSLLTAGRGESLMRVRQMQEALRSLSEPEIELEEEAQKSSISEAFSRLGEDGKAKVGLIDMALWKIAAGEYGICESCGDDIAVKRLEVIPWARLCVDCAREFEAKHMELPEPSQGVQEPSELPEEYAKLSNDQLIKIINDRIDQYSEIDSLSIKVSIRKGVVFLEGTVESELDRQTILRIITEDMGFSAVGDFLETNEPPLRDGDSRIPMKDLRDQFM